MGPSNGLPRRMARADASNGPRPPILAYTAAPHIIAKFLAALKAWNPEFTVKVESVEDPDDPMPTEPLWQLWAWEN